ncbi:MAG: hypothetical protein RIQ53_4079 [Pseudomonadota bacterium]
MRIAYLTSHYARASDTFIRNEVAGLRARGHEVLTYSIRRESAGDDEELRREQATTTYILEQPLTRLAAAAAWALLRRPRASLQALGLALRTRKAGLKGLALQGPYLVEAALLAREMVERDIAIVHNHIAENSATVAMLASVIAGRPFSMTVHGPGIFYRPGDWALGEKLARAAFTAAITDFCRSQCMLFADPAHWSRIHIVRCTPGAAFRQARPLPVVEAPRLLFVGRLCAEKGVRVLIDAFVAARARGVAMQLVLVGDGPLRGEIEALVRQHGLQADVSLLGWRSSPQVRDELQRARAFVLPSFAEGLPVAIMEAFSLGRPVITTRIAGIPELVEDGRNGWLVAPGSVEALTDALIDAAQLPVAALQARADAAVQAVRERHDLDTELGRLEALLLRHGHGATAHPPLIPTAAAVTDVESAR